MAYTIPVRMSRKKGDRQGRQIAGILVDESLADKINNHKWSLNGLGRPHAYIDGKDWYLHRFVWMLAHGSVPPMLDHINGDKLDNRLENLRPANHSLNNRNRHKHKARQGGLPVGVLFDGTCRNKYYVRFRCHGSQIMGGRYATPEEASAVYQAMKFMLTLTESALCGGLQ
jgi:hypothetical protein